MYTTSTISLKRNQGVDGQLHVRINYYWLVEGLFLIFSAGFGGSNLNIWMLKICSFVISRDIASLFILFIRSMETLV